MPPEKGTHKSGSCTRNKARCSVDVWEYRFMAKRACKTKHQSILQTMSAMAMAMAMKTINGTLGA